MGGLDLYIDKTARFLVISITDIGIKRLGDTQLLYC